MYQNKLTFHRIIQVIVFVLLIIADQLTKFFALNTLKDKPDIVIIKNVLCLHYLENSGAAFGIFKDQMWTFILITAVVFALLIFVFVIINVKLRKYIQNNPKTFKARTYGSMIMLNYIIAVLGAGAIGNFIDRILYRHVIDFIYVSLINFPVFNFADICVVLSAAAIIIFFIFVYKEDDNFHIFSR